MLNDTNIEKRKKIMQSKRFLLFMLLTWTSVFIPAEGTDLTLEDSKQQYAIKGVGFHTSPFSSQEYLIPPFYQAPLLKFDLAESTIITANEPSGVIPKLHQADKFDDLPLACSQTISTQCSLPFTGGKQKIESQYTINTSIVAFSVKGNDGKNYDYFHIGQEHTLLPLSRIIGKKLALVSPVFRIKMVEISAEPLFDSAIQATLGNSITIAKSSPTTTKGATEVTNSIEVSLGASLEISGTPKASITPGLKFGKQEKFSIQDISLLNNSGRSGNQAVWLYKIGNSKVNQDITSPASMGGLYSSVQWIWRIDRDAAIESGLYQPLKKKKGSYKFSFFNSAKSKIATYRNKTEPLTKKVKETPLEKFPLITVLVPPAPKEDGRKSFISHIIIK